MIDYMMTWSLSHEEHTDRIVSMKDVKSLKSITDIILDTEQTNGTVLHLKGKWDSKEIERMNFNLSRKDDDYIVEFDKPLTIKFSYIYKHPGGCFKRECVLKCNDVKTIRLGVPSVSFFTDDGMEWPLRDCEFIHIKPSVDEEENADHQDKNTKAEEREPISVDTAERIKDYVAKMADDAFDRLTDAYYKPHFEGYVKDELEELKKIYEETKFVWKYLHEIDKWFEGYSNYYELIRIRADTADIIGKTKQKIHDLAVKKLRSKFD